MIRQHYWRVIITIGVIVFLLEIIEHISAFSMELSFFYYGEIIFTAILLIVSGFLMRVLDKTIAEKTQALNTLRVKNDIGRQLSAGSNLKEMSEQLVQEVSSLVPGIGIELYLYENNKNQLYRAANANMLHPCERVAKFTAGLDPCRSCFLKRSSMHRPISTCDHTNCPICSRGARDYCLQLSYEEWFTGVLHLAVPRESPTPDMQLGLLESLATDISSTLGIAVRKIERDELFLNQKINNMRLDIARDLHDTIGQNISYMRMKLEQLSETRNSENLSPEVKKLAMVANESYDLVRGTLAMLQPNSSASLQSLLSGHANLVMDRSDLEIQFSSQGTPRSIDPRQMRQVFYIFRESLSNIEKHAQASQVSIEMSWQTNELSLSIIDNGRGFDPDRVLPESHYGLKFMRDRTEQLKGEISISSRPGAGTSVTIRFPYEMERNSLLISNPVH